MTANPVLWDLDTRGVATVTLNRPEVNNAYDAGLINGVLSAMDELGNKPNLRVVVLKGNGSVIAAPDGAFWINPTGNPGMASAGMGDVLSGIVAALCAQGADPLQALLAGTYLHGAAADALVASGCGPVGITASEVIDRARVPLLLVSPVSNLQFAPFKS